LAPGPTVKATDTTGAGDSFNAGYLATRLGGGSIEDSVAAGRKLAGIVVQHRGAIIPRAAMP
jgi:2-dehydro-3-deoxygluconokinase